MGTVLPISQRGKNAPPSPVRKLVPLSEAAKAKGIHVYHINIGDPDFEAPKPIIESLQEIAKNIDLIPYVNSKGDKDLLAAWQKYYKDVGIDIDTDDIVITSGGSEALIFATAIALDPGEEFIVLEPFYANYNGYGNLTSSIPVPVALDENTGFHLPEDSVIEAKITSKTKAIFFTNPNNPTGTVFTKEEVRRIINIANRYNLFIIGDETYRGICFEGKKMSSVFDLSSEEEKQRIIMTDSISKRLSIPGARIGAIISKNKDVIASAFRLGQTRLSVAYIEQKMVTSALSDSLGYLAFITKEYEKRRNIFLKTLEEKLQIKAHYPEGAFYTMVRLPVDDAEKFAAWLLTDFSDNNETVMVAPGAGFYATAGKGKDEVRVAYVLNEKKLQRAAELLALGVEKYNSL